MDSIEGDAVPPPSKSLSIILTHTILDTTILPSSLAYHSVSVDFTHDNAGLLAVFQLLLITLNTYNNGLFKTWTIINQYW